MRAKSAALVSVTALYRASLESSAPHAENARDCPMSAQGPTQFRDFAKGVAGTVSLPIFSVFFRFLPFLSVFFLFFRFHFCPFWMFFSGSDFFPFSSVFFHFFLFSSVSLSEKTGRHRSRDPFCETPTIGPIQNQTQVEFLQFFFPFPHEADVLPSAIVAKPCVSSIGMSAWSRWGCFSSEKPYHFHGDSLVWTGPQ